jgi:hypothetical protein
MAANSKALVIAGQQAPASGSVRGIALNPGQMRLLRAIVIVGVLLVIATGVDVALYLGMV